MAIIKKKIGLVTPIKTSLNLPLLKQKSLYLKVLNIPERKKSFFNVK